MAVKQRNTKTGEMEGNSLSEEQLIAILEGRPVQAPPDVLLEVKNALAAYKQLDILQPQSLEAPFLGPCH